MFTSLQLTTLSTDLLRFRSWIFFHGPHVSTKYRQEGGDQIDLSQAESDHDVLKKKMGDVFNQPLLTFFPQNFLGDE